MRDQRAAFLVVGVLNTIVGFGIFMAASQTVGHVVDRHYSKVAGSLVRLGINHVLSVLFAFVGYRRFAFRVRGQMLRDLARFCCVYLAAAAVNFTALPVLVELGPDRIPAQAVIAAATALVSDFGHRHFSFRRPVADAHDEISPP